MCDQCNDYYDAEALPFCYEVLPFCCGVLEFGEFPEDDNWVWKTDLPGEKPTAKDIRTACQESKHGLAVAVTTPRNKKMAKVLEEAGFTAVEKFKNPNTEGTALVFWMWKIDRRGK